MNRVVHTLMYCIFHFFAMEAAENFHFVCIFCIYYAQADIHLPRTNRTKEMLARASQSKAIATQTAASPQ